MTENFISIISSSFFASLFTVLITNYLKKRHQERDYKNKYYEKILDKRIKAYDDLDSLINEFTTFAKVEDGKILIHSFFLTKKTYLKATKILNENISNTFWLSNEASNILSKLQVFIINKVDNEIFQNIESYDQSELHSKRKKHFEDIRSFVKELKLIAKKDVKALHKINSFFNKELDVKEQFRLDLN